MCLTNWILGSKNVLHGYNHRLRFRIYSKYVKWSLLTRKTQRKSIILNKLLLTRYDIIYLN